MSDPLKQLITQALEDRRLSRGERQTLAALLDEQAPDDRERAVYLSHAFAAATDRLSKRDDRKLVAGLYEITKTIVGGAPTPERAGFATAYFTPGDDCAGQIRRLIRRARSSVDVCVFTITDDRLSNPLVEAHRRPGTSVRIMTDDEKSLDPGSDIHRLRQAGVPVRFDCSPEHMHHKFALFDRRKLVTGSYNWTRSANERNQENIAVTDDPRLVERYLETFETLWRQGCGDSSDLR